MDSRHRQEGRRQTPPTETRTELRASLPLSQINPSAHVAEPVRTQASGTDQPPASCRAAGILCPWACQPIITGTSFRARGHHLFPRGQQQPGSLGVRQVGSAAVREQSSGVLLDNSADIEGSLDGLCCPPKKRHLLDLGREVRPLEEGWWASLSPSEAAPGKFASPRCKRKRVYSRSPASPATRAKL